MLLVLLFADWACDTQFGTGFLCRPMSSSQITVAQAIGDAGADQQRERTASPPSWQALAGASARSLEPAATEVSIKPWPQSCKLTYVLMSVRR